MMEKEKRKEEIESWLGGGGGGVGGGVGGGGWRAGREWGWRRKSATEMAEYSGNCHPCQTDQDSRE